MMKKLNMTCKNFSTVLTKKIKGYEKPTIWYKFSKLAATTNSLNLGQGFPDWSTPEFYLETLKRNVSNPNTNHQYTRCYGSPKLVESIARNYEKNLERKIDPLNEVIVSNGAVSLLYNTITSLVEEGDEVIVIDHSTIVTFLK
jgi:aspartate/methionine/tyrosine aminotransferase